MEKPQKDYDCVAEVRKVRNKLDALWEKDPAAFMEWLEGARERYYKSLGIEPFR
ncbi:hypothetical protein [Chitinophaga sp.]|uniref:hypothetical protein n=1 Tax=Chitinophaga sp. TaxID=1869181 RepID=UPI0031D04236